MTEKETYRNVCGNVEAKGGEERRRTNLLW